MAVHVDALVFGICAVQVGVLTVHLPLAVSAYIRVAFSRFVHLFCSVGWLGTEKFTAINYRLNGCKRPSATYRYCMCHASTPN